MSVPDAANDQHPHDGPPEQSTRQWLDEIADRFDAAWQAVRTGSSPPKIEDFLADVSDSRRSELLRELILLEVEFRQNAGEALRAEDYLAQFPSLDPDWLKHILTLPRDAKQSVKLGRPLRIRCPHCQVAIELIDVVMGSDVLCPKCGSVVSSAAATVLTSTTADTSPAAMPEEQRFGRFLLRGDKPLGMGSFGEVWCAYDPQLQREVALKFPRPGRQEDFFREAQAAARLKHPNIVTVFEVGEATYAGRDKWPYIASELVYGQDLAKVLAAELEQGRLFSPNRVAEICRKVSEALHAAHEAGVIHRDLKPQNILLDNRDEPRVMDFGMAKRESQAEYLQSMKGDIFGSPAYMSPEQTRDSHAVDRRTDIWALGVILFELLTGERPFRGERDQKLLLDQIRSEDPPAPSKLNSQVPADLDTLCLKCLEKEPSRRFVTADDLAQELRRWLTGHPILARPVSRVEHAWRWCRRNPAIASLSTTVALVLLIGMAVSWFFASQSSQRANALAKKQGELVKKQGELIEETDRANRFASQASQRANDLANKQGELIEETKRANRKADEADENAKLAQRHLYAADMKLAQLHWENNAVGLVLDRLERHRPKPDAPPKTDDLRGFEWYYWDRLCHSFLREFKGHTSYVRSVAFSPDGARLASASDDGTVKLWDVASGQETATLKGHQWDVTSVAFSPDGARLASAGHEFGKQGGEVKLWDVASGQETATLKGHTSNVSSVAFSPDGARLASASGDRTVKLWDVSTGQETATLKGYTNHVNSVAFSPDGTRLASASGDGTVKLWDVASGQKTATLIGHTNSVTGVAFSPDGARLASASRDQTVKLWDVASGQETATLKSYTSGVAFSPDGARLASASYDHIVKLWDVASGQETATLKGHTSNVNSVAISPDGARLASASEDQTVKLWDVASGQETATLKGHTSDVMCVAFSPGGARLASTSADFTVKLWDVSTGQETATLKGHTDAVNSVAFSPDGTRLASASYDQTVKLWDVSTGQETATLKGHTSDVMSVAFSPDGARLASASHDQTVKLWDARPWTPELRLEQEARCLLNSVIAKATSREALLTAIRDSKTFTEPARNIALQQAPAAWTARQRQHARE